MAFVSDPRTVRWLSVEGDKSYRCRKCDADRPITAIGDDALREEAADAHPPVLETIHELTDLLAAQEASAAEKSATGDSASADDGLSSVQGQASGQQPTISQLTDELERLASLHASGALTDSEFQAAKATAAGNLVPSGGPAPNHTAGARLPCEANVTADVISVVHAIDRRRWPTRTRPGECTCGCGRTSGGWLPTWPHMTAALGYVGDRLSHAAVGGTFICTPSHDQRPRSLSTALLSLVAAIPVGPESQSRWSARSEMRTNDLDRRRSVEVPGDGHQGRGRWLIADLRTRLIRRSVEVVGCALVAALTAHIGRSGLGSQMHRLRSMFKQARRVLRCRPWSVLT